METPSSSSWVYQSIEVVTLTAKYLINQFYGVGPHHSYWVGCSTGGRQGMVMSQNFRFTNQDNLRRTENGIKRERRVEDVGPP
jgi:hypothetical protein